MKNSFYIKRNNKNIKCNILYTFSYNKDNFMIYNDGSLDDEGFLNVFANKFTINNEEITLLPIENNEWNIIDNAWENIYE